MKISPPKKSYLNIAENYTIVPVYTKIKSDLDTALSVFIKSEGHFFLESVENIHNVGRYSIIGIGTKTKFTFNDKKLTITEYEYNKEIKSNETESENPLLVVRKYLNNIKYPNIAELPPFNGGLIGYLGYETVSYFEKVPTKPNEDNIPDGILIIPEKIIIYDAVSRNITIIVMTTPFFSADSQYNSASTTIKNLIKKIEAPLPPLSVTSKGNCSPITFHSKKSDYLEKVKKCREYIKSGEIIQAVLAQKFSIETYVPPLEMYRTLRILNPSPYMFYLDFGDLKIIGSSPEVMVRMEDKNILLKPIAGTRKRGTNEKDDDELEKELLSDKKELAEHLMLVDLGRNDLGRVAVPGTVDVPSYMVVEKYSHVMHIVSTVTATIKPEKDAFDLIRATFPAGTLSGAPKIRAIEIIHELENEKRGPYGGMILTLGFNGNLNSCITIRTMILKDNTAYITAGAGIVYDSIPLKEYDETINKAKAIVNSIRKTHLEN